LDLARDADGLSMTNWADAIHRLVDDVRQAQRQLREDELRCPHCGAANRPGATYVTKETATRAVCMVCGKAFNPEKEP
jgi:transcription elongation factor Elf1